MSDKDNKNKEINEFLNNIVDDTMAVGDLIKL